MRDGEWWVTFAINRLLRGRAARIPAARVRAVNSAARRELGILTQCRPDGRRKGKWLVYRRGQPREQAKNRPRGGGYV